MQHSITKQGGSVFEPAKSVTPAQTEIYPPGTVMRPRVTALVGQDPLRS